MAKAIMFPHREVGAVVSLERKGLFWRLVLAVPSGRRPPYVQAIQFAPGELERIAERALGIKPAHRIDRSETPWEENRRERPGHNYELEIEP